MSCQLLFSLRKNSGQWSVREPRAETLARTEVFARSGLEPLLPDRSDAAALRRTAPVMRNWRDVADHHDMQTGSGQRTHGRFSAGPRALHAHFNRLETVLIAGVAGGTERRLLCRIRSALARALEADCA